MENALVINGGNASLPMLISEAGVTASTRFVEFFTAQIRNPNTRSAYYRAANRFLNWCEKRLFLKIFNRSLWPLILKNSPHNIQRQQ